MNSQEDKKMFELVEELTRKSENHTRKLILRAYAFWYGLFFVLTLLTYLFLELIGFNH